MIPLNQDLRRPKNSLLEFKDIAIRVLEYLPNVLSDFNEKSGYKIHWSFIAGTTKFLRPINQRLFIYSSRDFQEKFTEFELIIFKLKLKESKWVVSDNELIDSILYTIQQAIGVGFDLLVNPNSGRKHVGNRFEELMKVFFTEIGISNKKITLQIPYKTDKGIKTYKCENDLVLSPFEAVKSTAKHLDENETVVSIKTTSKDRMGKIFIDKILL